MQISTRWFRFLSPGIREHHPSFRASEPSAWVFGRSSLGKLRKISAIARLRFGMGRIDPENFFRLLYRGYIEIYHDGFLVAAHDHAHERFVHQRIDLLMRNKRRHIDEVSRSRVGKKLQAFSPAHACLTADHIDNAL